MRNRHALASLLLAGWVGACHTQTVAPGRSFDALARRAPRPAPAVAGVAVSEADYQAVLRWGADWFRYETFGGERTVTDVVGLLNAPIEVPCAPDRRDCYRTESSLPYFVRALDELDGVLGNLFVGNGGTAGPGCTHDLTLRFPAGSRLHGLPLPAEVRTGLDVEAGSPWPIGLVPVAAGSEDEALPYLWELEALGAGPIPAGAPKQVRVGITCALCHYSLDVDWDGRTDLTSARLDTPTPGSPYRPEHSWSVGNQDLKVGWLFAMSQNPLVGFSIFSGPIGPSGAERAIEWVRWVKDHYRSAPAAVTREVVRGMLLQPRGYADVSSNARYNASQFPPLYTQHNWPSNSDGAVLNAADRNSVVWTTTLDFSGLVGLAADRGGAASGALFWEESTIYSVFSARELAELMVYLSPAALHDPKARAHLRDDILGISDGVPGLLDPDSVYVMQGPGNVIPPEILNHPENKKHGRIRQAAAFGGDAQKRGPVLALLGMRAHTRPKVARAIGLDAWLARNPGIRKDEFMGEAVNAVLDWQPRPPNLGRRLARAQGLLPRGQEVFREAGCESCHHAPFFTDNVIHRLFDRRAAEIGIAPPSTAPWRTLGRGSGPAIRSEPSRSLDSRPLTLYVAPTYDPVTGLATAAGDPLLGLFGSHVVGYKSTHLYYLWGSPPYLHDGGVGVAVSPKSRVDGDDLGRVLALPANEKIYGMGAILAHEEAHPGRRLRADAALSLQALLLRAERERVLERKHDRVIPVPGVTPDEPNGSSAIAVESENPLGAPAFVSAAELGIDGGGHDFYLDDVPGGERVTALVAFLLALDEAPGELSE